MVVAADPFDLIALADPDRTWELHDGELREKPSMSVEHGDVLFLLAHLLQPQLDRRRYRMRTNHGHTRISSGTYYVPDVMVLPIAMSLPQANLPGTLERYPDPLPLVIEIWSKSTGTYDVETKLARYQERGDEEIWRFQPYKRTLIAWRRQPDGRYEATTYHGGIVPVVSLPGVALDLDAVFADLDIYRSSKRG